MPTSRPDNHEQLPPLAAEDYTCDVCALIYSEITIDDAVGVIAGLPGPQASSGMAETTLPDRAGQACDDADGRRR